MKQHFFLAGLEEGWLEVGGVVPTGKSISVSVTLRACEAVCRRVRDDGFSGAGAKKLEVCGVPGPLPGAGPGPEHVEKKKFVFSEPDRIRILS